MFEVKYLTNPEYFHSSYDYYIISDYRLNEVTDLSYHYYNFYQNDGDLISRNNTPFIDQYNIQGKTFVLVANINDPNLVLDEYVLLEYDDVGVVINQYSAFLTQDGVLYLDGRTLIFIK